MAKPRDARPDSASPITKAGSAPNLSTIKPARVCPTPEIRKKIVRSIPTSAFVSANSALIHGNRGGNIRWKKCDVPCPRLTSPIVNTSFFKSDALIGNWLQQDDVSGGGVF